MSEKTLRLTVNEGQNLLAVSLGFALPEKIGDTKYALPERALADRQVGKLFLALRDLSPMYKGKSQAICFGPEKCWEQTKGPRGEENYRCIDGFHELEIPLRRDIKNGLIWCLLLMLHPQSPVIQGAGTQAEDIWPVAEKLGCVRMLRDQIGLPDLENEKSPWDSKKEDADYEKSAVESAAKG